MKERIATFGEIMLRLSPPNFQRFIQARSFDAVFGGGEANVAVSLANFGFPVDYVTKLPFNENLACSKVLSLITGGAFGTLVEGTNVLIYLFPLFSKVVLLKIHEGSSEMPDNEQEPILIIEKKNEFFYLSSPYFELAFQIFDEDDSTIKENFEKLKSV